MAKKLTVGILGVGAIGGLIAAAAAAKGYAVTCITTEERAEKLSKDGLPYRIAFLGEGTVRPNVVTELRESPDILIVTVKAPHLDDALKRVEHIAPTAQAVSLLNGTGHLQKIRDALKCSVSVGTIGHLEAYREADGVVVSESRAPTVELATERGASADEVIEFFESIGVRVETFPNEVDVIWRKLSRLGPLAAVTAASKKSIGEVLEDDAWRARLDAAIDETAAVALHAGASVDAAANRDEMRKYPPTLTTSLARDIAKHEAGELDSIVGSIVAEGEKHSIPVDTMRELYALLQSSLKLTGS